MTSCRALSGAVNPAVRRAGSRASGSVRRRAVFFTALLAGVFVAACDDPPPPKTPSAASGPAPAMTNPAKLPPQMVAAVSAGKSSDVISVHFALGAAPAPGKELPVDIALVPHRPFTAIRVHFEGHESLGLSTGKQFAHLKQVDTEDVLNHKLMLQPSQEGLFLVTAAVETEGEDGQVVRIYSIPVIVHAPGTPAKPDANPPPAAPAG